MVFRDGLFLRCEVLMIRALLVVTVLASSLRCAAAPPQNAATPQTQASKPKPKKVWTDENLREVGGTISVVGEPQNAPRNQAATGSRQTTSTAAKTSDDTVDPRVLAELRQQLQKLQSDLALIDRQLLQLKGFSKGDSKNAGGLQSDTWQYNSSSVEEQIHHLQEKKTQIQSTIGNLLDAARASGIEPGQLR
jgi:hypothetical protein